MEVICRAQHCLNALISAVGFKLIRKPLSKLDYADPALVVNPLTYHVGRGTMRATTATYAAVDDAVVSFVKRCYWVGNNPVLAVDAAARRMPLVEAENRRPTDGGRPSTIHLRASIGLTVLVLTIVLTVVLWLLI